MTRKRFESNNFNQINNNITSNVVIGCLLVMLFAMTFSATVLKSTSLLIYLYALAFIIQITLLVYMFSKRNVGVSINWIILNGLYFLITLIPIVNDFIQGISINSFDYVNCIVKTVNFFFFCVLFQKYLTDQNQVERVMRFIVIIGIIACFYSFITEFNQILAISSVANTNALGISSFFSNRNQYAAFLVCAFTASLYLYENEVNRQKFFIYFIYLMGILTTFSRGALFSIIIMVLIDFYLKKRTMKKLLFVIFVLLLALVLIPRISFQGFVIDNYVRINNFDSGRVGLWKLAYEMAKEKWFLGMGFYTASDQMGLYGIELDQFHSMYMDLLVGGGIAELLFIIAVIYVVFRKCKRYSYGTKFYRVYTASLISFLVYGLVESMSLFSLSYGDTINMIMYIVIPLLISNMKPIQ